MKAVIAVVLIIVLICLAVGGMYVGRRNQMVTLNEQVKSNWAQVDVVLQRRADLIPNLVETVKGFAAHEEQAPGVDRDCEAGQVLRHHLQDRRKSRVAGHRRAGGTARDGSGNLGGGGTGGHGGAGRL